jgi:Bacterial type II and III secretion system protein
VPGLAEIPFLRYLFSSEQRERNDVEVMVMLTPHVVRLPEGDGDRGGQIPPVGSSEIGPPRGFYDASQSPGVPE